MTPVPPNIPEARTLHSSDLLDAGRVCASAIERLGVLVPARDALWVLSHLASERRLLLVGDPGLAKSLLARRVGSALAGSRTLCLDAALTSFDDVRGFIRPGSLEGGTVEIVPGPWSPYDTELLFVDELSRAQLWQQGRWLQLVHERRVDGRPTAIRWVLCAMNPPTDGLNGLTLALADRFHAALELTPFDDLEQRAQLHIASGVAAPTADAERRFSALVAAIRAEVEAVHADTALRLALSEVAVAAVGHFNRSAAVHLSGICFHGRRAVHIRESLESLLGALMAEARFSTDLGALSSGSADIGGSGVDNDDMKAPRSHALAMLRERLREVIDTCLGGILRTTDLPVSKLGAVIDAAYRAALATWDELLTHAGRHQPEDTALMRSAVSELDHPALRPAESATLLSRYWHLSDGPPSTVEAVAVIHPGLALAPGSGTSSAAGVEERDDDSAAAFLAQLSARPAFVVPLAGVPDHLRAGLPQQVVSESIATTFWQGSRGGVFHPAFPARDVAVPGPIVVYARPSTAWRALVSVAAS